MPSDCGCGAAAAPHGSRSVRFLDLSSDDAAVTRRVAARRVRCTACGTTSTVGPDIVPGTRMSRRLVLHLAAACIDAGSTRVAHAVGVPQAKVTAALDALVAESMVDLRHAVPLVARQAEGVVALGTRGGGMAYAFATGTRGITRMAKSCSTLTGPIVCDVEAFATLRRAGVAKTGLRLHRRAAAAEIRRLSGKAWQRMGRTLEGRDRVWRRRDPDATSADETVPGKVKAFLSFRNRLLSTFMQRTHSEGRAMIDASLRSMSSTVRDWFAPVLSFLDLRSDDVFREDAWNAVGLADWAACRPEPSPVPALVRTLALSFQHVLEPRYAFSPQA